MPDPIDGGKPLVSGDLERVWAAHKEWLESGGRRGARADLMNQNLSKLDLRNRDLRFSKLTNAAFSETLLSGALLYGSDLRGADLSAAVGNSEVHRPQPGYTDQRSGARPVDAAGEPGFKRRVLRKSR